MSPRKSTRALERTLREALQPVNPGADFYDRVMARLEATAAERDEGVDPLESALPLAVLATQRPARRDLPRWAPVALVACVLAGAGVLSWYHEVLAHQRAIVAREQLLQALRVASASLDTVRGALTSQSTQCADHSVTHALTSSTRRISCDSNPLL